MARADARSGGSLRVALARGALAAGLVALALGAWWSWPRAGRASSVRACVLLIDASRSARSVRSDWPAAVAREIERERAAAHERGESFAIVRFGARALRLDAGALARELATAVGEAGGASDLARALDLADEIRREARADGGRVVLVGDGSFTGAEPSARIDALARDGFEFELRALAAADRDDVALDDLRAPRFVREGEACLLRAGVWSSAGAADARSGARIEARIESPTGVRELAFDSAGAPGLARDCAGYRSWSAELALGALDPGPNRIRLRVRPSGGASDAYSEDDALECTVVCGSRPVAVLAGRAGTIGQGGRGLDALAAALRAEDRVALVRVAPEELAGALGTGDVLVTCGVEKDELPTGALGAWLRSGGGWLAFADERLAASFVADAAARGAFALLPLVPPSRARPPRELVFLLDASGSMSGENSAALERAILELVGLLDAHERLELRFFAGALGAAVVHAGGSADAAAERARLARELIAARPPGGPTRLLEALESWSATRAAGDALVFVCSDGRQSGAEESPAAHAAALVRARELATRLAGSRARVVCIATGTPADEELLDALRSPDAPLERAGELDTPAARERVQRLLARELAAVRKSGRGERAVLSASGPLLDDIERGWIAAQLALVPAPWPPIDAALEAELAPGARSLWIDADRTPLLAVGSVGVGRAAACAFEPGGEDAPRWSDAALFVPLVHGLARAPSSRELWLEVRDGRLRLHASAVELPARVAARVRPLEALDERGHARGDERAPPAELVLEPGDDVAGWTSERSAAWPAELEHALGRFEVELALEPRATRIVELAREPEERFPRRFLDAADVARAAQASAETGGAPSSHAHALVALAAGLVALGAAALLGLPGRGFAR